MDIKKTIYILALQNAIKYEGRANPGSIMGLVFGMDPKLKQKAKEISKEVQVAIKKVNKLSLEEQKKELEQTGEIQKKQKKQAGLFDFLRIKKGDKIITAFPPGPEKYPHIGHAKAILLNYLLAKEYNGKFILRFEDTNPTLVKKEFYKIMEDDFTWLGVRWDNIQYASDNMELFYKYAEQLIKSGDAYLCYCDRETISKNRRSGTTCECHNNENQLKHWKDYFKAKQGSASVRLRIDMKHQNTVMRDPTIFRIIDKTHARLKNKYRVWPNYDFQNAIMDGKYGITHRLRSKEFELRSELQTYIQKLLKLYNTTTYEFARFNLEGVLSSGREIREKIESKELSGWDDPRLTTLAALRRRGFLPEAIKDFIISTGISKAEGTLTWDNLIVLNKKYIDKTASRYSFIEKPIKIKIKGAKKQKIKAPLHPETDKGYRNFETHNEFYIQKSDKSEKDQPYRFMHLFNFKNNEFLSEDYDSKLKAKLIHWLPVSKNNIEVEIVMNDNSIIKGLAESNIKNIKLNEVIQFERFGFCKLDKKEKNKYIFYYTHR
ncbi:glutamate--tRNA ligase [archaeon]|jgi:glutamyl-tRNA synthetase|nr:glutamate--tRNA ligase [archaeon]